MRRASTVLLALLVVASSVGAIGLAATAPRPPTEAGTPASTATDVQAFNSSAEFAAYRERAADLYGDGRYGRRIVMTADGAVNVALETAKAYQAGDADVSGVRVSDTNVQETGIDEPDLVKTDGEHAYYSPVGGDWYGGDRDAHTSVFDLRPARNASEIATIDDTGRLLRVGDTLVVLGGDAVTGYDVADADDPNQVWNRSLDGRVVSARLMDGEIYLVVASGVADQPCPVEPMAGVSVPCTDVYHPDAVVPVEVTYTVMRLDPATGETSDAVSFVGSRDSVVYMSETSLYVATTSPPPRGQLLLDFLLSDARDVLPDDAVAHLRELRTYDLTDAAVYAEASHVVDRYLASLSPEERRAAVERLGERYEAYTREHRRSLTTTHITRVAVPSLSVAAGGSVPGTPLNQFSLDEHEGHLRIATTVSPPDVRWEGAATTNDVYVLNRSLGVTGSVQGMSDGQRVYSVRFVGDTGYVVTFRRVDPLHVLDLSDPQAPVERGALKLPGFSRYLHPLSGDRLLGIGEEDGNVKAVIFDVSQPTDPKIAASRVLAAEYTAVENSHHAFLLDPRHDVFFLPTDTGGMVLSTENLSTKGSYYVPDTQRAVYVGNHLYLFSPNRMVVVDETTWKRVRTVHR